MAGIGSKVQKNPSPKKGYARLSEILFFDDFSLNLAIIYILMRRLLVNLPSQ
jgi:hypothetical protein